MLIQIVFTVSFVFAAFIFGTLAVNPETSREAKGEMVAELTKAHLAAAPGFRTAKPIDDTLVSRANPNFDMKDKASPIAPTLLLSYLALRGPRRLAGAIIARLSPAKATPLPRRKVTHQQMKDHLGNIGRYTGDVNKAGKADGDGVLEYDWFARRERSFKRYEGQFKKGKFHGEGKFEYIEGQQKIYEGQFKNGHRHGQGKMTYSETQLTSQLTYTEGYYKSYKGQWKDGKMDGQGKFTYAGDRWDEGIYKNGILQRGKNERGRVIKDGGIWLE